ncbi:hypothetical protein [Bacillus thuringiensis]|uniref:hypothetical protein n=1 Tax=Bacillus thuringiensis TaxID=1428 RepID=UPI000CD8CC3F|nr:hypothetical protein [Bacillus thuringiensis]QFQ28708.1 hypothetical protein DDE73_29225 [Bacillus thuringiensis]
MTIVHWRHLWNQAPRLVEYTFNWSVIRHDSYVLITAAEARTSAVIPDRFIGAAKPIVVGNIAPFDGGVKFTLWWYGDFPYLNIWTDFTIFDPNDPSGSN